LLSLAYKVLLHVVLLLETLNVHKSYHNRFFSNLTIHLERRRRHNGSCLLAQASCRSSQEEAFFFRYKFKVRVVPKLQSHLASSRLRPNQSLGPWRCRGRIKAGLRFPMPLRHERINLVQTALVREAVAARVTPSSRPCIATEPCISVSSSVVMFRSSIKLASVRHVVPLSTPL